MLKSFHSAKPLRKALPLVVALLALSATAHAQSYAITPLASYTATTSGRPSTDGITVVNVDVAGNIVVTPVGGGASTTIVATGATLPNGLGAATSFSAFGWPVIKSGVVYFGAQSASGSGYYSVPATGGSLTSIIDSSSTDASGRAIRASAIERDFEFSGGTFSAGPDAPVNGVDGNLYLPAAGGAIFAAGLYTASSSITDQAILSLSPGGGLTTVLDTAQLSGCSTLSGFATDGTLYAAWALTSANHLVLLENNAPSLTCANVLLDLGAAGMYSTGILPGQPSSGTIQLLGLASGTVIDSGYIYFSATISLANATGTQTLYSGIFRIQPGGSIQKVLASDDTRFAAVTGPDAGASPIYVCCDFAVRGNNLVVAEGVISHYGAVNGIYVGGFYAFNQATSALLRIAKPGDILSANHSFYSYTTTLPTPASLAANGEFVFNVSTSSVATATNPATGPNGSAIYSANLSNVLYPTTTSLATPTPITYGTPGTLTATVTGTGAVAPTGMVTFANGTTSLGSTGLSAGGVATLSVLLPGGTDSLTATYAGDSHNATSTTAAPLAVVVNRATPVIGLTTSATSVTYGTSVPFIATAAGIAGAATPTGNIAFDNGTTVLGSSPLNTAGTATLSTTALPLGANPVIAAYIGDTNYLPANSSPASVTVSAVSTTTALSASITSTPFGTTVTLTALVSSPQGTPSGTVTFSSNNVVIGTGAVNAGGSAILAVNNLPLGVANIVAVYGATTLYPASSSNTVQVTITPPTIALSATATSLTVKQGQTASMPIGVTAAGTLSSAVSFACVGLPVYATCAFSPQTVTPGTTGASTTLTLSTNVQTASLHSQATFWYAGFFFLGLLPLRRFGRNRRRMVFALVCLVSIASLGALSGCNNATTSAPTHITPTGTSTVAVTATSASVTQTLNLTITVTQ